MAKTNITTTLIPRDASDYSIHKVNANTKSDITDTTLDANNEMIIIPNDANSQPLDFDESITITGDPNVVPFAIKNFKKDHNHWRHGIFFRKNVDLSNISIESAGPLNASGGLSYTAKLRNVFVKLKPNGENSDTLFRFNTLKLDIDGLIIDGGSCALDSASIIKFDNYSPRNMAEGYMHVNSNGWDILNGFNPINCTKDFG